MSVPDGTPINAVFGLGMTLQKLLNEHQPELAACCFDAGAKTFRNELFPAYKANRSAPPKELVPQFDLCRELVGRMGIAAAIVPGYEADDLLATLTRRLHAEGYDVVIVTATRNWPSCWHRAYVYSTSPGMTGGQWRTRPRCWVVKTALVRIKLSRV